MRILLLIMLDLKYHIIHVVIQVQKISRTRETLISFLVIDNSD